MTVINYNDECNNDENNAIVNSTNINGAIHMHHNNTSDNITQSSTTDNNSTSSDCEEGGEEDLFDTKVEICRFRKYSLAKPEAVNLFQNARFYSNVHRKRRIEPKPKAFIMFADLDGTFTPMDLEGKQDFVKIVREIQEQTGCHVKFVPVSGRPCGYVLRVLHDTRDMLAGVGVQNVCDYGAAEQGAVIVDSSRSYDQRYLGWEEHKTLKAEVGRILRKNKHWPIISDEPDKLYTCSIHIKNEAKAKMSREEQQEVYLSCKHDICAVFGDNALSIAMSHNCMEVMHKEISKSYAMNILLTKYQRHFNITGLCMCGDAENDKIAMNYVSRLAEIPGVQAHVFTPANAQKAVSTSILEFWKNKNPHSSLHRIRKGPKNLFLGVTWLIRDELANGTLIGPGLTQWEHSYDDLELMLRRRRAAIKPFGVSPVKFF